MKKEKTKKLEVIRIDTNFFITPLFPAPAMSLYLKPVFALVRSRDGKLIYCADDINVVKEFAWVLNIKHEDVTII